jgi:hypothetical protein
MKSSSFLAKINMIALKINVIALKIIMIALASIKFCWTGYHMSTTSLAKTFALLPPCRVWRDLISVLAEIWLWFNGRKF